MLDFTKKENDNIKFLFDYIQVNGSENLSKLFEKVASGLLTV